MPTRLHAEEAGDGVLLSRIEPYDDAPTLCKIFARKGQISRLADLPSKNAAVIFLPTITMEGFASLIEGSNVELI
jgi:hypothetical protein